MESLKDMMGRYHTEEPKEIAIIKRYIAKEFGAEASVGRRGEDLIIIVNSGSLANSLRMRLPAIQAVAKTKRRLIFRIG